MTRSTGTATPSPAASTAARRPAARRWRASSPAWASACCRSGSPPSAPSAARSRRRRPPTSCSPGIEHAVDPNGDGDTSDHVPVVLVGVNAPYAGFTNSPEAEAVEGAEGLGTLIVAPAGNEGAAKPGSGTIGSPASARDSLAVGALAGDQPQPRTELTLDGEHIADAAVLAGDPPPNGQTAGPVSATDTAALGKSLTRIKGKVVIVEAGANPAAQAAAAAAVGARAVVIAKPGDATAAGDQRRPLRHTRHRRHRRRRQRPPQGQAGHRDRVRRHRAGTHLRRAARRPHLAQHLPGPDRRRPAEARPGGQGQRAERRRRRQDRADRRQRGRRRPRGRAGRRSSSRNAPT